MISKSVRDLRRTWPQLLLTDFVARGVAVVAITPAVGLLIKIALLSTDTGVLTDQQIATFLLLSPVGWLSLLVVGGISFGVLFAEQGALMVVSFGATQDRRVTWLDALRYVARYGWQMVRLGRAFLVRMLLLAAPFLIAAGAVYALLLRQHDINFYLTDRPPEMMKALALGGLIALVWASIALRAFAGWIVALPLVLFEGFGGKEALHESSRRIGPRAWKVAGLVVAWLAGAALLSALVTLVVGWVGDLLVPNIGGNLALTIAGLGITLVLGWVGVLLVSICSTALFPVALVRFYGSLGTGRMRPEPAPPGSLGDRHGFGVPGKVILWGVAAGLLVVFAGGYLFSRSFEAESPVEIIAHRGASGSAPENTLAAFERAIVDATDWIELDVQENADGSVVVAHDSDFMKVARDPTKVWNATDADLRGIDIGSWYAPEFADERPPTLEQALVLARGKAGVVIELKYYGHDHELESRVVDIVERTGTEADIKIMSLKLAGIRKASALRPDWTYGLLNTASVGDLTRLDLDYLALNVAAATPQMIRRAHGRGMKVYVWTVNDPVRMSVMMSRGVDGIITDEPALARQVIEFRQRLSPIGRMLVWIAGEAGLLRADEEVSSEAAA